MCAIIMHTPNREAEDKVMRMKITSKLRRMGVCFAVFLTLIISFFGAGISQETMVHAVPIETPSPTAIEENTQNTTVQETTGNSNSNAVETQQEVENANTGNNTTTTLSSTKATTDGCKATMGAIGWIVCPVMEKVSEAVDWLYEKIEDILLIDPIPAEDGTPIYEIWKYCLSVTNVVFIIFFLVVIYSQLTGWGITNYGIKKTLPKLIVMAILVNLSFLICSLAVDVSNIVGHGLRGVFEAVERTAMANMGNSVDATSMTVSVAEMYTSMAGGTALAVGAGVIAFELGAFWMLIPTVLGAIVAVATGLITIALRQAVIMLLVMVAPLALVASILPNTENLYKKWKQLLMRMLVFYPMFSLLFGAASLAGFAIITSAKDGFGLLLGVAVQIFPLFFSWKLMQMSGTVLGDINARMRALTAKPLAVNRAWADSHRQLTRARHLERNKMPSARLMNFLAYRKTARENEMDSVNKYLNAKYTAKSDARDYTAAGKLSRRGQRRYDRQALTMRYTQFSNMHADNLENGFSEHDAGYRKTIAGMRRDVMSSRGVYSSAIKSGMTYDERILALDNANMNAADDLKAELARRAEIDYKNSKGFFDRAINAKLAEGDQKALQTGNTKHQMHSGVLDDPENLKRYERWKSIMQGKDDGVQTVLADAASSLHAQAQIRRNKFQAAADLTPATQNVADHIGELVNSKDVVKNIDAIIGGLRVLRMRGDTDLVAKEMTKDLVGVLADNGNIKLGSYASQALANYLMFDVKESDPVLRRFGKYINMQTAAMYNESDTAQRRVREDVSWWEYINSGYVERDGNGNILHDEHGNVVIRKTRGMRELLTGTSYSGVERTAYKSQREGVRAASYDIGPDGQLSRFDYVRYLNNMDALYNSTLANIIGDQFSYLSGSEQIVALAKDMTGIGKNGKWDWKYIFGDELRNPSIEQKAEYIMRSRNLMKTFLGGHVPSQIARSKTDMLMAIEAQYALFDEVMYMDEDGNERVDLEKLERLEEREFTNGNVDDEHSYKHFLASKGEAIKKRFQNSFKPDAVKGFAKQFMKGYQGEAKDMLIRMLDPEALYEQYFPYGERRRNSRRRNEVVDDEDDGMPVDNTPDDGMSEGGLYNDTRERMRESFERFRGAGRLDVEGFWSEANQILRSSTEMGDLRVALDEFADRVPQYTDASQLYLDIIRTFFGSD